MSTARDGASNGASGDRVTSDPRIPHLSSVETRADPRGPAITGAEVQQVFAAWHHERIAVAAYYLSERRGFAPGHEDEDWREAQAQIDALDAVSME